MSAGRSETDIENVSQGTAAKALGMTPRWFRQFSDAPRNSDKSYSIPVVVAWWLAKKIAELERDSIGDADPDSELAQAKLKQIYVNTQIRELELAERKSELLPALDVRAEAARVAGVVKQRLLSMPALLAARVQGLPVDQCAHAMELEIRDVLDELEQALRVEVVDEEREAV